MDYLDVLLPHWPFPAAIAVFYVIVKAMKAGPLSAKRAQEVRWVRWVRRWFPLPLHPIVAGAGLGFVPGVPVSPGVELWELGPAIYFGGAGAIAVLWRNIWREWCKYKGVP